MVIGKDDQWYELVPKIISEIGIRSKKKKKNFLISCYK